MHNATSISTAVHDAMFLCLPTSPLSARYSQTSRNSHAIQSEPALTLASSSSSLRFRRVGSTPDPMGPRGGSPTR